jgi:protein SHQ1
MLTPVFECSQENGFIVVRLFLSAICKVMDAAFDINDFQFTFYCSPYYLRLRFDQCLQEGKGERATYDLENNVLTVYLPKANPSEEFTRLDNPAYLIATEKQRTELIRVLAGDAAADHEKGEEMEETEYVQTLQDTGGEPSLLPSQQQQRRSSLDVLGQEGASECGYGFASTFSGIFRRLDPDVVREVVSLRENPEEVTSLQRHQLRVAAEMSDFNEDALLLAFEDADGDIAQVLRYVPAHITDFRRALQGTAAASTVVYASIPDADAKPSRLNDALEEEETTLVGGGGGDGKPVTVWSGNIADFQKPLIEELDAVPGEEVPVAVASSPHSSSSGAPSVTAAAPAADVRSALQRTRLAIPKVRPVLHFTRDENEVLQRLKMPRLLFPPAPHEVEALTVDILCSEAYDDLVTEGNGCSESLWNVVQLSPALSYLDPADTVYDACVAFARRALIYPIYRHCALLQRVWAVVGTRLLLGKAYTIRALLRVRMILSHAEHKHLLSTIFLDPLIAYWMNTPDADERLMRVALEIHQHVSRTKPVTVAASHRPGVSALHAMMDSEKKTLNPLTLLYFGLPLTDDEEGVLM